MLAIGWSLIKEIYNIWAWEHTPVTQHLEAKDLQVSGQPGLHSEILSQKIAKRVMYNKNSISANLLVPIIPSPKKGRCYYWSHFITGNQHVKTHAWR